MTNMNCDLVPVENKIWVPIRTKSRREKKLAEYCHAQAMRYYLPLLKKIHKYGKRRREFFLPMFPGYIFCCLSDEDFAQLVLSHSVLFKVKVNEIEEPLLLEELRGIRVFEQLAQEQKIEVKPELVEGTPVEISTGPFRGLSGIVQKRKKRALISVNVEILGHSVSVEVDADELELVS